MKASKPRLWYCRGLWFCAISKFLPDPIFNQERMAIGIGMKAEEAYQAWKDAA